MKIHTTQNLTALTQQQPTIALASRGVRLTDKPNQPDTVEKSVNFKGKAEIVDKVAKSIRQSLVSMLSKECTDLNGIWVDAIWTDDDNDGYHDITGDTLFNEFYINTGANKLWGYCKNTAQ